MNLLGTKNKHIFLYTSSVDTLYMHACVRMCFKEYEAYLKVCLTHLS
jgi:hypothetical protein